MSILDRFCSADAFWQRFDPRSDPLLLRNRERQRRCSSRIHPPTPGYIPQSLGRT